MLNRFLDEKPRFEDDFRLDINRPGVPIASTPVRPGADRALHMGTIIQLTGTGVTPAVPTPVPQILPPTGQAGVVPQQYYRENEEYGGYYQGNNLTYPRIADESVDSPKRLSLDDR